MLKRKLGKLKRVALSPTLVKFCGTLCAVSVVVAALLMIPTSAEQALAAEVLFVDQLSQYGITFTFDKDYPTGQFANGDYWVVGPVTITRITPDFDGTHHGWEVNPIFEGPQGFDERA